MVSVRKMSKDGSIFLNSTSAPLRLVSSHFRKHGKHRQQLRTAKKGNKVEGPLLIMNTGAVLWAGSSPGKNQ